MQIIKLDINIRLGTIESTNIRGDKLDNNEIEIEKVKPKKKNKKPLVIIL